MNQKAKVTFFLFFFFDQNQPMTQPLSGKNGVLDQRDTDFKQHDELRPPK